MKAFTAFLTLICLTTACSAAQRGFVAVLSPGRSAEDLEWRREAGGFGASVLITPDPDWRKKCGTAALTMPCVDRTDAVHIGGKVWAVVLLSNPLPDQAGNVNVTCDLRLARPNGKISEHRGLRALQGRLAGPAARTYLSEIGLTMVGEEGDPLGEWVLELVVRDRNRGVEVPIVGRYTLLPKEARH